MVGCNETKCSFIQILQQNICRNLIHFGVLIPFDLIHVMYWLNHKSKIEMKKKKRTQKKKNKIRIKENDLGGIKLMCFFFSICFMNAWWIIYMVNFCINSHRKWYITMGKNMFYDIEKMTKMVTICVYL